MTNKQRAFCDEYLIDRNATRAYLAAYPHVKSSEVARKAGSRLLTNVDVDEYIKARMEEISAGKVAQAQEVMEYLTAVLRGESAAEIVVVEGQGDGISRARRVQKLPDEKERLKAAELLAKRYGLFTENVKIAGGLVTIVDDIPDDAEAEK
ncbi:MAG: terminase small subunit [Clostridia bacterium]|nr:terminase small subunit [Clostridia bacterium]